MAKTRVLIVDDSALIRKLLSEVFEYDPDIEVVGTAPDPLIARDKIKQLNPDVITLDIEMPKMDGIAFLKNLMRLRPMPVVMISTLTEKGAPATLQALELGAIDYFHKPRTDSGESLSDYRHLLCEKVKMAATAKVRPLERLVRKVPQPVLNTPVTDTGRLKSGALCAIGASTGGTEAIKSLLLDMAADCPPIVITQHIPEAFSESFAKRLNDLAPMRVVQVKNNQPLKPGGAYLAPGNDHLQVARDGAGAYIAKLSRTDPVNRHRPSVDVLFNSIAVVAPAQTVAVLLTGMGKDGAEGLLNLREAGAFTIAQDEASSVVWGMPGAAVALNAVDQVVSLEKMAPVIVQKLYRK